jgi:hypothetical protein
MSTIALVLDSKKFSLKGLMISFGNLQIGAERLLPVEGVLIRSLLMLTTSLWHLDAESDFGVS